MNLAAIEFPTLPEAACANSEQPDAWFSFNPREREQARNICRRCPEVRDCLTWALTHSEHGIWAGTDESQRTDLAVRHGIKEPA